MGSKGHTVLLVADATQNDLATCWDKKELLNSQSKFVGNNIVDENANFLIQFHFYGYS